MRSTKWLAASVAVAAFVLPMNFLAAQDSGSRNETYKVDPVHTSVIFRIKHLDTAYFYGRFDETMGEFTFSDDAGKMSFDVTVNAASINTHNTKRDDHLKSKDFFAVGQHGLITFKSKSVKKVGDHKYEAVGELSLLGKSRPMTVTLEKTGENKDPWGGYRMGWHTTFDIKRSDFGMDYMMNGLSDEVQLMVAIEGIRQ